MRATRSAAHQLEASTRLRLYSLLAGSSVFLRPYTNPVE
jgi:hypothetical protein